MRLTRLVLASMLICLVIAPAVRADCGYVTHLNASSCYGNGKVDLTWEGGVLGSGCTRTGYKIEMNCGGTWSVVASNWATTAYTYPGPCCGGWVSFRITALCSDCTDGPAITVGPIFCGCSGGGD